MRSSTLVILVGILVCGSVLLLGPGGWLRSDVVPVRPGALFPDLRGATRLEFERLGTRAAFERDADRWVFSEPRGARVRPGAIPRILNRLEALEVGSLLTEEAQDAGGLSLEELGLVPPAARILLRTAGEERSWVLGSRSAFDKTVYVQEIGRPEVMTVSTDILSILPEDPLELRDMSLGLPPSQVLARLEIDRADGFFQAVRGEEGEWSLTQPDEVRLDQKRFLSFLDTLAAARMEQIVSDQPGDLGRFGLLDKPTEFRWWTRGAVNPGILRLGSPVEDAEAFVYGQGSELPTVFTISGGVLHLLRQPLLSFRDRRLLPLDPETIIGVRIMDEESTVTLTREGAEWTLTDPIHARADASQVQDLLRDWTGALAMRIRGEALEELVSTNAVPEYRLVFQAGSSNAPAAMHQLHLYRGGESEGMIVYQPQEETVAEAPAVLKAVISLDPLRYHDRQICAFERSRVVNLLWESPDQAVSVLREEEAWRVEGNGCILDETAFAALLPAACKLRANRLVSLDPPEIAPFGLDQPVLKLTLGFRGGDVIRQTLLVGSKLPAGGGRYAMIQGRDLVFTLDEASLDILQAPFCLVLDPE